MQCSSNAESFTKLGWPRRSVTRTTVPERMPTQSCYHSATDPMGVTACSRCAQANANNVRGSPRIALAGKPNTPTLTTLEAQVRVLGFLSSHGALELEIPELLKTLFTAQVVLDFILYGSKQEQICEKTKGSRALELLCTADAEPSPLEV
eukprot:6412964-Amphidinium_carterae.1